MTSVITPVSPSAPAVPQNSSGSESGVTSTTPFGVCSVNERDVVGDAAVDVVVLAVHVGRQRAADGHEPGARRDGHEPAEWQQHPHQRVEAHAGVDPHDALLDVERTHCVEARRVDDGAARVLRGVAVGAAEPAGDEPARPGGREQRVDVGRVVAPG